MNPSWTTRLGDAFGRSRDADGEQEQGQRKRKQPHAGFDRRDPERDRQEQRNGEEDPRLDEEHEEEGHDPVAQLEVAQHRRVDQRALAALDPPVLPPQEQGHHYGAGEDQPDHRRKPQPLGASGFGCTSPHVPALRMPSTIAPSPTRTGPCRSGRAGRPPPPACPSCGESGRGSPAHDDLPGEHPPPRRVRREHAADQRPERRRDRAGSGDEPYARGRSGLPKFDATSATIAGMISTAPSPSRPDQPIISTVRFCDSAVVSEPHA